MVQKSFLTALLLLALSSCAKPQSPIEIVTQPVDVVISQPPDPNPLVLNNITWKILNIDDNIYYGISVADYELLAANMLDIKRYLAAQKNIIKYYKQVTIN